MKRYCLTLDLKNDPILIAQYENYHCDVWPEVKKSIIDSGIIAMEIYRFDNRLLMIMEVDNLFSFKRKAAMDASNIKVQEWELLMEKFQQPVEKCRSGVKWMLMDKIFDLGYSSK